MNRTSQHNNSWGREFVVVDVGNENAVPIVEDVTDLPHSTVDPYAVYSPLSSPPRHGGRASGASYPTPPESQGRKPSHYGSSSTSTSSSPPSTSAPIPFIPPKSIVGMYAAGGNPVRIRRRQDMTPAGGALFAASAIARRDPNVDDTLLYPSPPLLMPPPPSSSSNASASPPPPSTTALILRRGALRQLLTTGSLRPRTNIHATFWVPNPHRGEVGLLELIHRRGSGQRQHILLQSRPMEELKRNFSPANSSLYSVDLSHNAFRLSKTALAVAQMNDALLAGGGNGLSTPYSPFPFAGQSSPSGMVRLRAEEVQSAVLQNLQTIQEEEYYLVRYRDYSPWAVKHYPDLVKESNGYWRSYFEGGGGGGKRGGGNANGLNVGGRGGFVEQCFAVHVGREAGELIPITEAQMLYGQELIDRQLAQEAALAPPPLGSRGRYEMGRSGSETGDAAVDDDGTELDYMQLVAQHRALNESQFHSLWAILGQGFVSVGLEGDERRRQEALAEQEKDKYFREFAEETGLGGSGGGGGFYKAPAWYDWRPSAIQRRMQHQLHRTYQSVGRMALQIACLSLGLYLGYYSIPGLPSLFSALGRGVSAATDGVVHSGRGGGSGGSGFQESYRPRRGFFGSLLMGPKDVADYLLAPLAEESGTVGRR